MNWISTLRDHFPGFFLASAATVLAWFVGPTIPGLNEVIFGLLLGVMIGNVVKLPKSFTPGLKLSSSKVLDFTIVMMAFEVNLRELIKAGFPILLTVLVSIVLILIVTVYLTKWMSCPGANGWLIGFGTAICGSSAISALGPIITKDKSQIGISIAVVNILGGLGIFLIPGLISIFNLDAVESGVMVGGSLHSMAHVAGSAAMFDDDVRNVAISVKLVRIALLTPALILFSNIVMKKQGQAAQYSLKLPTYLILFIIISLFVTFVDLPKEVLTVTKTLSKIGLTLAMVAIGMNISFRNLMQSGGKSVLFGSILFLVFSSALIVLIKLLF